jgi:DNA-binding NarL/FixJ family response regulator
MTRTILLYGLCLAAFVTFLKLIEYRYFIHEVSLEFYVSALALLFTGIGVWVGLRLTRRKTVLVNPDFRLNEDGMRKMGISQRELEVLDLMSKGLSNQEIADKLFVSVNTVKTHSSNVFVKLDVRRRTQAIQKARELQFIP